MPTLLHVARYSAFAPEKRDMTRLDRLQLGSWNRDADMHPAYIMSGSVASIQHYASILLLYTVQHSVSLYATDRINHSQRWSDITSKPQCISDCRLDTQN